MIPSQLAPRVPPISVLNNSGHTATEITVAISTVLGSAYLDSSAGIFVDETSIDDTFIAAIVARALNTSLANIRVASGLPSNKAPYQVINNSFAGWTQSIGINNYAALQSYQILNVWAYAPLTTLPSVTQPSPLVPNLVRQGDALGYGVEFGMTLNYKGLVTTSLSSATAGFAGLMASLWKSRLGLNAFDVQAAFRQTASNWASGYNKNAQGYGYIDYDAALIAGPLYLQPPFLELLEVSGRTISFFMQAFDQSRRTNEFVYLAPASYVWPIKNEYTQSDLDAAGMILMASTLSSQMSLLRAVTVSASAGSYVMIGFTCDGNQKYSRVESFGKIPVTLS